MKSTNSDDEKLCFAGKTVVVTRSQDKQSEAHLLLNKEGVSVLDLPALVIGPPDEWGPLDDALRDIETFHWLIFSSSNGVSAVEKRLKLLGKTLASLPNSLKIAAVGHKTAMHLEQLGAKLDFVPPQFVADSLIKNFPVSGWGLKMLVPRVQSGGRTILAEAFGKAGAHVVEVAAYESSCPQEIPERTAIALDNGTVNAIAFASGKTAAHTAKLMQKRFGSDWLLKLTGVKLVSIGPQTSISCTKYFSRVDNEAVTHDVQGLIKACLLAIGKKD